MDLLAKIPVRKVQEYLALCCISIQEPANEERISRNLDLILEWIVDLNVEN